MSRVYQSLLLVLATASEHALAQQVQYLKVENKILRSKLPRRITVTAREKQRLLKFGRLLGTAIKSLITIVSPRTFARWLNGETNAARPNAKIGRPRTAAEIRQLVLQIARDTGWGYTRIHGELKKLGVVLSRSAIVTILKEHGMDTGPQRGAGTWADFIKRHAATLWACDFFSQKVWTKTGLVDFFVLFFLHIGSRRVHVAGLTTHPDRAWVAKQAHNATTQFAPSTEKPRFLLRDRDGKFGPEFDAVFAGQGTEVIPVGPHAPNLNAFAERWVLSVRQECLDHFVILGEKHLRHLLTEYETFYNEARPHQGVGNMPLIGHPQPTTDDQTPTGPVQCQERLGGLLRHYYRKAA